MGPSAKIGIASIGSNWPEAKSANWLRGKHNSEWWNPTRLPQVYPKNITVSPIIISKWNLPWTMFYLSFSFMFPLTQVRLNIPKPAKIMAWKVWIRNIFSLGLNFFDHFFVLNPLYGTLWLIFWHFLTFFVMVFFSEVYDKIAFLLVIFVMSVISRFRIPISLLGGAKTRKRKKSRCYTLL